MAFMLHIVYFLTATILLQLLAADTVWAWGPGIHAAISFGVLSDMAEISPAVAGILRGFPLEYIYGSLAADFFVGKGQKRKQGHSHNWETGYRFLQGSRGERDAAYAYGFLSHLAADVVAHNYYVPELIHRGLTLKRMGHLYWEAKADRFVGPFYTRAAREVLSMDGLRCDELLRLAVGKRFNGIRARRNLYTQSVKISDFLSGVQPVFMPRRDPLRRVSRDYMLFMINLSYRLVRDFLRHPQSSACLGYDPIGSRNLRLAGQNRIVSRLLQIPRPTHYFPVDRELLEL